MYSRIKLHFRVWIPIFPKRSNRCTLVYHAYRILMDYLQILDASLLKYTAKSGLNFALSRIIRDHLMRILSGPSFSTKIGTRIQVFWLRMTQPGQKTRFIFSHFFKLFVCLCVFLTKNQKNATRYTKKLWLSSLIPLVQHSLVVIGARIRIRNSRQPVTTCLSYSKRSKYLSFSLLFRECLAFSEIALRCTYSCNNHC